MNIDYSKYNNDINIILSKQLENGSDYWTTPDGATGIGGPFSTLESCLILSDLGYDLKSPELIGASNAILNCQKDDGRIQTFTTGTIYPYQTANAAKVLCRLGLSNDKRLSKTYNFHTNADCTRPMPI